MSSAPPPPPGDPPPTAPLQQVPPKASKVERVFVGIAIAIGVIFGTLAVGALIIFGLVMFTCSR